jgi:hypothetical protein
LAGPGEGLSVFSTTWRVMWIRFVSTFRRRLGGHVALVLLVGLVGGLALGSVAAARRTQSSFPAFVQSTNPSDMNIDVGTYNPALISKISRLPQVTSLKSYVSLNLAPVTASGKPDLNNPFGFSEAAGSINALYFNQDNITIVDGRMANPRRADEVVVSRYAAQLFRLHVGQRENVGIFSNAQITGAGTPSGPPLRRLTVDIVGIGVFNDEVIQDDTDRIPRALFTPALTDRYISCCVSYAWSGLQLRRGASDVAAVEREYLRLLPPGDPYYFHVTSIVEAQGDAAVKPESIALGIFGLIAGLAALFIGAQAISRQIRLTSDDRAVLRFLGASPLASAGDGVLGIGMAVVTGTLLAAAVALGLSPFELFGPVRSVDPSPGFSADWTVLGLGALALLSSLGGLAFLFAYRGAPDRVARRGGQSSRAPSPLRTFTASSRLSTPAVTGVRFALDAGRGRSSVPVRSAISGSFLAITVTVAALVFGSSLQTLINTPRLYGWNWNVAMESNAGYGDIPEPLASNLLSRDHAVAAFAGVYFETFAFDGVGVPVLGMWPRATVQPPLIAGHGLNAPDQVVLGPATMAQLHLRLGDTVQARYTTHVSTLRVVGVATMPAIGIGHGLHLSLGVGALLDYTLIPESARNIQGATTHGPNMMLVRFRDGINPTLANRSINRILAAVSTGGSVLYVPVQRPAQIVNYRSMGSTPTVMAGALALGAFGALGLTLVASVRRRRRDLALFKTLGFTRRQLVATIAWQATVTVGIGTLIGIPVGLAAGRALWDVFAHEFYAISDPTVPVLAVALLGIGALILANVAAFIPGRYAAATPTALVLRAE